MTAEEVQEMFEAESREFLKFERVASRRSNRPDLHAFLLLDALVPGTTDIVAGAEHDEIYLGVEYGELAAAGVTPEQVVELVRCGVRAGEYGLAMFA